MAELAPARGRQGAKGTSLAMRAMHETRVDFSLPTFSDSGHPALRPSGQLRCSRRSCGAVSTQEKVGRAPKACESSLLEVSQSV